MHKWERISAPVVLFLKIRTTQTINHFHSRWKRHGHVFDSGKPHSPREEDSCSKGKEPRVMVAMLAGLSGLPCTTAVETVKFGFGSVVPYIVYKLRLTSSLLVANALVPVVMLCYRRS